MSLWFLIAMSIIWKYRMYLQIIMYKLYQTDVVFINQLCKKNDALFCLHVT